MRTIVNTVCDHGLPARVCAVVSNKADAPGLNWARDQHIDARAVPHRDYASRQEFDLALARVIDEYEPHYVLLARSEEHTSELQSLMRISYAVFCLKKKKNKHTHQNTVT